MFTGHLFQFDQGNWTGWFLHFFWRISAAFRSSLYYVKGEMNGSAGGVMDNEKKIAAMEQQIEELK